jgi:hypothetical protein
MLAIIWLLALSFGSLSIILSYNLMPTKAYRCYFLFSFPAEPLTKLFDEYGVYTPNGSNHSFYCSFNRKIVSLLTANGQSFLASLLRLLLQQPGNDG